MSRRLLVAALSLAVTSPIVLAQEGRPAVRIIAVRADEDATARSQMPDPVIPQTAGIGFSAPPLPYAGGPAVMETRGPSIPPPVIPNSPNYIATTPYPQGTPVPNGVTVGPAVPMGAPPAPAGAPMPVPAGPDAGLFPMPQPDAPLFAPGSPFTLPNPNSTNQKFWASAEYLYWRIQGPTLPVLITTGPAASNGILGATGTQVLLGNGDLHPGLQSGGRYELGYWFGNNQCFGIEFGGFFVGTNNQNFVASSPEYPLVARPFTNLNSGIPFSQLTAYPGLAAGGVAVNLENNLWGLDTNFVRHIGCGTSCFRLEALLGFRYINYSENLTIAENFARTPGSPLSIGVPTAVSGGVVDQFNTKNEFYGGQMGLQGELRRGRWFINTFAKVALGDMHETINISGGQTILQSNGTITHANGGLLALPGANIGSYTQNKFAVAPETGFNVGYNFTPHLRAYVGYNFLYMSNVVRPGNQIDTGLDVTRIPNFPVTGVTPLSTVRPAVPFNTTGMYVQGINFGLQFSW